MRSFLVPLLLAACAHTYHAMPAPTPELKALAEAATALPNETGRVRGADVAGEPVDLHYRQTRAEGEWLVVLLHGVLSDSRTWDYVAGDLGLDHSLLLIDLPGCGRSDKPSPDDAGRDGYSPTALARHVLFALRARLAATGPLPRVALVGHSLGTMVILRMLGDPALRAEFPDVIARVERVALLSPVDFAVEKKHPTFERIAKLSAVEVTIANITGILQESAAVAVRQGAVDSERVPQAEAMRLVEVLSDRRTRRAGQAMIVQAVPFTPQEHPDWPRIRALVSDYRNVDLPCLIVHGASDETFGASVAYKLQAQLPDAWLLVLADRKHALPSEAPRRCAGEIRAFLGNAGEGRPRIADETYALTSADGRFVRGAASGSPAAR